MGAPLGLGTLFKDPLGECKGIIRALLGVHDVDLLGAHP